jgi:hypothetical protein
MRPKKKSMNHPKVVHIKKEAYDVYVGRPTQWGNPFTHLADKKTLAKHIVATREEAVEKYREWITEGEGKWLLEHLPKLKGKTLACWCHPKACHADVLFELANKE